MDGIKIEVLITRLDCFDIFTDCPQVSPISYS